jgi:hypothetical protein
MARQGVRTARWRAKQTHAMSSRHARRARRRSKQRAFQQRHRPPLQQQQRPAPAAAPHPMYIDLVQPPRRLPAAPRYPKQRVTATLCKSFERRDPEWGWAAGRRRSQWMRRFAAAAVAYFFNGRTQLYLNFSNRVCYGGGTFSYFRDWKVANFRLCQIGVTIWWNATQILMRLKKKATFPSVSIL